jgi:hypothetical protein
MVAYWSVYGDFSAILYKYNIAGKNCLFNGLFNNTASNSDCIASSGRESEYEM